ncbi:sensor histidine kinase [Caldichromatium japonicum]|uniref:histidine kinase n=1 Tax=Caldichromatium japonicum TaxID=2699430 RepID=A0A6G7V9M8_9GAMM|nr:sensor histidine kinase [Caldichromatium japonicum]QIK36662.1 sensor histidine kinase [Caldichromatium japonicum]
MPGAGRSLRGRLWLAAGLSIALALLIAAFSLSGLFARHVERHLASELDDWLNQLAAAVTIDPDGSVRLTHALREPAFNQPLSGLYWQVDRRGQPGILRSRSLWDEVLRSPNDPDPAIQTLYLNGPAGQTLLVRTRWVRTNRGSPDAELRLILARDRSEIKQARDQFAADQRPYLLLIALLLLLATAVQIQTGLAPLESLRREVELIRLGRAARLSAQVPDEVQPLIHALNDLLDARERAIERARAWTADLAHGMKTPLNVLAADAERLRRAGHPQLADDLEQLAETMRRQVERELIRARVRSGQIPTAVGADLGSTLRRIQQVLTRTPTGERLRWQMSVPAGIQVALMPEDLFELLGNLLENANKWAHTRVEVYVHLAPPEVMIEVADDGPGVDEVHWSRLGERGLRLDEQQAGHGLGLAIVRDVIDAYGGALAFGRAEAGGLSVRVRLPLIK